MKKAILALSLLGMSACSVLARAENCSPDFGDQALNWVLNHAGTQSRQLAKEDYAGRTFNYRLVGYERLHARLVQIDADLDAVGTQIQALDNSRRTDVGLAIEREQLSERFLTLLYTLAATLESVRQQNVLMRTPTDQASFRVEGYSAVGRETLIASMRDIGESSATSLGGRYGVYVSVTFDENGNPQSGHAESTPGGKATTIGVALISTQHPYAVVAGAVLVAGGAVINASCARKWEEQRDKVIRAADALPAQLITEQEQWILFQTAEQQAIQLFDDNGKRAEVAIDALDGRWKTLFAANAARAAAAEAVLTVAKVDQIRRDLAAGFDPGQLRQQVALTEIARGIGQINAAVARGRIALLTSCLDTAGIATEENQREGVRFARAQFKALHAQGGFAPLYDLLNESDVGAQDAEQEVHTRGPSATQRACRTEQLVASERIVDPAPKSLMVSQLRAKKYQRKEKPPRIRLALNATPLKRTGVVQDIFSRRSALNLSTPGLGFCVLLRQGAAYSCGASGQGAAYGSGFNDTGNPRMDIQAGAGDAGFAQDSRRMSSEVNAARLNIDERIQESRQRIVEARLALPTWLATNTAALDQTTIQTIADQHIELTGEAVFRTRSAPLLAQVAQQLDDFVAGAADTATMTKLVTAVGGANMRLTNIDRTEVPPMMPEVMGVNAVEVAFGPNSSASQRQAMREGWKAEKDLVADPAALKLSRELIAQVERLESTVGGSNSPLTKELLLDSAALRFAASGRLASATIAVVQDDGTIVRQPLSSAGQLPANALLNVVRDFQRDQDYYHAAAAQLKSTLTSGGVYAGRRGDVLDIAHSLFGRAQSTFSAGDIAEGRAWLKMAIGALDIATRFIPGIDWGRDVYEAVSGQDLFTAEKLSALDRASAVIGVVSLGVGNNGLQVARVLDKLPDIPHHKLDEIYEFAKTADADTLESLTLSTHAIERMGERLISKVDIRRTLDNHTPFWSREHKSYVAVGNQIHSSGRIGVAVSLESNLVTTVMHMPKDNATLLAEVISEGRLKGQRRYKEIILDD